MAEVLLFHHAQRLTAGCLSFAEELRAAGHVVYARTSTPARPSATSLTAFATPSKSASTRSSSALDSPLTA
jgi:hypothetical protein